MFRALAKYALGIVLSAAAVAVLASGIFGDGMPEFQKALGVIGLLLGSGK